MPDPMQPHQISGAADNVPQQETEQPPIKPDQTKKSELSFVSAFKSNWILWVAASVAAAALIALLMSLKPDSEESGSMSDYMFDNWLKSSLFDDDDDYDRRRKRSNNRRSDEGGLTSFIPPIIINNPGQNPTIIPGRNVSNNGGNND